MQISTPNKVVIVGGGHGGANAAALLRQHGYDGQVLLVGDEAETPYQRPPLSKSFLKAEMSPVDLLIKPEAFYAEQSIDLMLRTRVQAIDATAKTLRLRSGEELEFDALILATGAVPRRLQVSGHELGNIRELRTRDDAVALAGSLGPGRRLVIVGGGYVGLEVAASARHLGAEVVVLEREERVLARVASPELASWLHAHHLERGTEVLTSADVAAFLDRGDGTVGAVRLTDGREFECDVALVGVGAIPCDELASAAGLACDGGIVVDDAARTSSPDIYAIGDSTRRPLHHYVGNFRLESIPSAVEQAKQAVSAILGDAPPKPEVPWFWSEQFDVKLKMAGLLLGVDQSVVRGDLVAGKFAVFHLSNSRVVAVEAVNSGADFMAGKQFIDRQCVVDPVLLADVTTSLRELIAA